MKATWSHDANAVRPVEAPGGASTEMLFRHEVHDLVAASSTATIYNTPEWIGSAYECLDRDRRRHLVHCWDHGALIGFAALTHGEERIHGLRLRTLRQAGHPLADRVPLLIAEDRLDGVAALLDRVVESSPRWDALVLNELPRDGAVLLAIGDWARARGLLTVTRLASRAPVLCLPPDGDYLAGRKSLATRLRRARKKLEAAGRVRFERLQPDPADLPRLLARLKEIEDASWKGSDGVGIFSSEERCAFITRVSRRFAERGWLDIGLLFLDDRLISYRYGFRFHEVFWDYNLAYDPACAALSPGRVLLDDMIRSSFELGLDAVDASRGSLATGNLLSDWTDDAIEHVDLWIFNPTVAGAWVHAIKRWVAPVMKPAVEMARRVLQPA